MGDADEKRMVSLTPAEFQVLLTLVSMERANELLDEMSDYMELTRGWQMKPGKPLQ